MLSGRRGGDSLNSGLSDSNNGFRGTNSTAIREPQLILHQDGQARDDMITSLARPF